MFGWAWIRVISEHLLKYCTCAAFSFPNCCYEHVYYYCADNPAACDITHSQNHFLPRPLHPISLISKIPLEGSYIWTLLVKVTWDLYLQHYPCQELVQFFLQSISRGFQIGSDGSHTCSGKKNLHSVVEHLTIVDDYLHHELSLGRILGPYSPSMCPGVNINRFGIIPKNYLPNKWRLITDLSHPLGNIINNDIPLPLCSLSYVTIDDFILNILQSGKNTSS